MVERQQKQIILRTITHCRPPSRLICTCHLSPFLRTPLYLISPFSSYWKKKKKKKGKKRKEKKIFLSFLIQNIFSLQKIIWTSTLKSRTAVRSGYPKRSSSPWLFLANSTFFLDIVQNIKNHQKYTFSVLEILYIFEI